MIDIFKKNKELILIWILIFLMFYLTPINGDDWGNYVIGGKDILEILNTTKGMYYSWEGRIVSRFLIFFLTYHKLIYSILSSSLMVIFIRKIYSLGNKSIDKVVYLIPIILLFMNNNIFFTQSYLWIAGFITYTFSSILVIIILTTLYKSKNMRIIQKLLLLVVSLLVPCFVENIGCAYVVGLFLMIIYHYIERKEVPKLELGMIILAIGSLIVMLKSPGSALRLQEDITFYEMSYLSRIISNVGNFIKYTFVKNSVLLIFMLIIINKMFIEIIKDKKIYYIGVVLFNIIPVITIILNIRDILPYNIDIDMRIFNIYNWYYIFYFGIFFITWGIAIYYFLRNSKDRWNLLLLFITGISSVVVMMVTPSWGERISVLYVFSNIMIITRIFMVIGVKKKWAIIILRFLLIMGLMRVIIYTLINYGFDIRRNNTIKEEILRNEEVVLIPMNKLDTTWQYNPVSEYHMGVFKNYYNISDKEIVNIELSWNDYIRYLMSGEISWESYR